jgi:hypothetical protein
VERGAADTGGAVIVVSDVRCSDCLAEFDAGPIFAVVKEDKAHAYSEEERQLGGHLYQVLICGDCAQWYEDRAPANDAAKEMEER